MSKSQKLLIVILLLLLPIAFLGGDRLGIKLGRQNYQPIPTPTPTVYDIYSLVNTERTNAGLPALLLNPKLNASAEAKCADMVRTGVWDHNLPDGTTPQTFIQTALPDSYTRHYIGENLAFGYPTASSTVNHWMASPGHRANILNPHFTEVGYAICQVKGYPNAVVQHFTD